MSSSDMGTEKDLQYDTKTGSPAVDVPEIVAYQGRWAKLLAKLEGGGVETRGLERVQEYERIQVSIQRSSFCIP